VDPEPKKVDKPVNNDSALELRQQLAEQQRKIAELSSEVIRLREELSKAKLKVVDSTANLDTLLAVRAASQAPRPKVVEGTANLDTVKMLQEVVASKLEEQAKKKASNRVIFAILQAYVKELESLTTQMALRSEKLGKDEYTAANSILREAKLDLAVIEATVKEEEVKTSAPRGVVGSNPLMMTPQGEGLDLVDRLLALKLESRQLQLSIETVDRKTNDFLMYKEKAAHTQAKIELLERRIQSHISDLEFEAKALGRQFLGIEEKHKAGLVNTAELDSISFKLEQAKRKLNSFVDYYKAAK
jgi:hypothetical protein